MMLPFLQHSNWNFVYSDFKLNVLSDVVKLIDAYLFSFEN